MANLYKEILPVPHATVCTRIESLYRIYIKVHTYRPQTDSVSYGNTYCSSKKPCPFLYKVRNSLYKNGRSFFNIQYIG